MISRKALLDQLEQSQREVDEARAAHDDAQTSADTWLAEHKISESRVNELTAEVERLTGALSPFAKAYLSSLPFGSPGYAGCPWWQHVARNIAATSFERAAVVLDPTAPRLHDAPRVVPEWAADETDWRERAEAAEALVARLRTMLQRAENQFRFYAEQHRAKGTPEADEKAATNEIMADACAEARLSRQALQEGTTPDLCPKCGGTHRDRHEGACAGPTPARKPPHNPVA